MNMIRHNYCRIAVIKLSISFFDVFEHNALLVFTEHNIARAKRRKINRSPERPMWQMPPRYFEFIVHHPPEMI
jgi:hypothetical protein